MHCIVVRWTIVPGEEERVRELACSMVEPSNAEPGCRAYILHEDPTDPSALFLYEQYDDVAAFDAHCVSPHFRATVEAEILPRLVEARLEAVETDTPVTVVPGHATLVRWVAAPGAEADALAAARRISEAVAADGLFFGHAVHVDPADASVVLVYEQFADPADFERHLASAYFAEIVEEGIASRLVERRRELLRVIA